MTKQRGNGAPFLRGRRAPALLWFAVCLGLFCAPTHAHAQGCSLCRDSTAGSAPRAQAGLRTGILILGGAAVALVTAGVCVVRQAEKRR